MLQDRTDDDPSICRPRRRFSRIPRLQQRVAVCTQDHRRRRDGDGEGAENVSALAVGRYVPPVGATARRRITRRQTRQNYNWKIPAV